MNFKLYSNSNNSKLLSVNTTQLFSYLRFYVITRYLLNLKANVYTHFLHINFFHKKCQESLEIWHGDGSCMYKWTVTYNFLRPKSNVPYAFIGHLLSVNNMYIPRYNYYLIKCNWHLHQPQCTSTWRDSWFSPFSHSFHQQYFSSKQEGKRRWGLGQATFFWPESGSGWNFFGPGQGQPGVFGYRMPVFAK